MQDNVIETAAGYPLTLTADSKAPGQSAALHALPSQTDTLAAEKPSSTVMVGTIVGLLNSCEPLVTYAHERKIGPIQARSTLLLTEKEVGQQVVLGFEDGDLSRPMVL